MRFTINKDTGAQIAGWVLPDNPAATPKVVVVIEDTVVANLDADHMRPALRDQGLHDTGRCGFVINERNTPGVVEAAQVEIFDDATGVRIYRRRPKGPVAESKLFRLELQLLRDASLNSALEQRFHLSYTGVERLSEETIQHLLKIRFTDSLHVTGRIPLRAVEALLRDQDYALCACLRDPAEELAEQLLIAQWAMKNGREAMRGALSADFMHLLDTVGAPGGDDPDDIERWINGLSEEAQAPLRDPAARLLTLHGLDEPLEEDALVKALDTLANFDVVGLKSDTAGFMEMLAGTVSCELPMPGASPGAGRVAELARHLRETEIAQRLLPTDLKIHSAVEVAHAAAAGEGQRSRSSMPAR